MVNDISGVGTIITLQASNTYPTPIQLTQFADDADSLDVGNVEIAQTAMGMNGNLVAWPHAQPVPLTLNIVPESVDDQALQVLANNNRVAQGKISANDIITITAFYPDGRKVAWTGGKLTSAAFGNGISNNGRLKTKQYSFMFEKVTG